MSASAPGQQPGSPPPAAHVPSPPLASFGSGMGTILEASCTRARNRSTVTSQEAVTHEFISWT